MIDYVVRHALIVVQINYVCQTSVEVLLLFYTFCHGKCLCLGYTSAAFSAGRIVIVSCCFRFLKAFCISFVMLGLGGLAC